MATGQLGADPYVCVWDSTAPTSTNSINNNNPNSNNGGGNNNGGGGGGGSVDTGLVERARLRMGAGMRGVVCLGFSPGEGGTLATVRQGEEKRMKKNERNARKSKKDK